MFRNYLQAWVKERENSESGSVAILVALAIFVLIIGAGAAVDMARAQILHTKIQSALDTSGLAAIASLPSKPVGTDYDTWATLQANRYFQANFPSGYLQTTPILVTAHVSEDENTVTLSATSTQNTTFMNMAGISTVSVGANSVVTRGATGQKTELVLVLDNTGSMNCDVLDVIHNTCATPAPNAKILALQSASNTLLDIIYGDNDTSDGLFVGVVPFSQAVNIGLSHINWMDADGNSGASRVAALDWGNGNSWAGCVEERQSNDMTEDPPYNYSPFNFTPYYYPRVPTNNAFKGAMLTAKFGYYYNYNPPPNPVKITYQIPGWKDTDTLSNTVGPNAFCPQEMLPMVASKATVKAQIASLVAVGNTIINEGLVWGWRMLSPQWRGLWGGDMDANNLPLDYNTTDTSTRKYVVLMSDGKNEFAPYNYTTYGWLWNFDSTATATAASKAAVASELDAKTIALCDQMKAKGIVIFTIGFGNASTVNVPLFESCAYDAAHVFIAPTDAALKDAFTQIGKSLVNLRVSQ